MGRSSDATTSARHHLSDDDAYFMAQYQKIISKGRERVHAKRLEAKRGHDVRLEALRRSIASARRNNLHATPKEPAASARQITCGAIGRAAALPGAPNLRALGNSETHSSVEPRLETLRLLLERKNDIEARISTALDTLETALHTTSIEMQIGLCARAAVVTAAACDATQRAPNPSECHKVL